VSAGRGPTLVDTSVVFDLDGTLVDSRLDFARLRDEVRTMLAGAGIPWPGAGPVPPALAELLTWARAAGGDAPDGVWARAMARVRAAERAAQAAPARPGALATLAALRRRGAALAVLTNNARDGALAQLDRLGLGRAVDAVFTRDDVPALKPDPRGLALCLARLGGRPRAYFVGDSWIDAAAAHALGVAFIALALEPAVLREHDLPPALAHVATLDGARRAIETAVAARTGQGGGRKEGEGGGRCLDG
jgi:phosphoglycolate phosphatase